VNVKQVSCGQSHIGLVTDDGRVFTWGSGEHGMLGHGSKQNYPAPKQVMGLASLTAVHISCGAFHTAIIAAEPSELTFVQVPPSARRLDHGSESPPASAVDRFRDRDSANEVLSCGSLYVCGLSKAGQLGLGNITGTSSSSSSKQQAAMVATPTLVPFFQSEGYRVAKVSAGFHHTLVIGVPIHAMRVFSTSVFSFGWGEHGRLGLGDEEQRSAPCLVAFPMPFHAVEISAGEQHSLAAGKQGCYSWGSNSMGQLGLGNPSSLEMATTPLQIPLPEGMTIKRLAAGGRHSACITDCGKVLAWGWGEEGQLGHGTEKSCYLPRPCRLPKVKGQSVSPRLLALGMSHTIIVAENDKYLSKPPPVEAPIQVPPDPIPEPEPVPIPPEPSPKRDEVQLVVEEEEVIVEEPPQPLVKAATLVEEDAEVEMPVPVRSIKELLQRREERK
jgi:alpha-tubulin suppressor-like RCC1 family protein